MKAVRELISAKRGARPAEPAPSPLVQDRLPGIQGFLQTLAGYYANFLETDFKKARQPKRRYVTRDRQSNRVGMRTERYDNLRLSLVKKLAQKTPASFVVPQGRYKASLSNTLLTGINTAIEQIDTSTLAEELANFQSGFAGTGVEQGRPVANELAEDTGATNIPAADDMGRPIDLEDAVANAAEALGNALKRNIVSPVLHLLLPVFEGQNSSTVAAEQLLSYSQDITERLLEDARENLATAVGDALIANDMTAMATLIDDICDRERLQSILNLYFSDFGASDAFVEIRELLASKALIENSEIYLNFGEIQHGSDRYPLYYVPLRVTIEPDGLRLQFETHIYVNKVAVDFVAGELGKTTGTSIPNPVNERIFYKQERETYFAVAEQTLHKILLALQVDGGVELDAHGDTVGKGPGFKVTNAISLSLCDRSDESIVNDYEALMSGMNGGDQLMQEFSELLSGFLTSNPISVDATIEQSWRDCAVPDRLVFESPLPLAEEQRKILAAIRNADSRFIAVEGPPGTGKSHTIAAIAFEMILQGKSILVLSDKTEALDVVENKLNDVIERVRSEHTDYVNPILRLGKTDSNYSNIVKNASIQKLKTSVATFQAAEHEFRSTYDELQGGLKANVVDSIGAARGIDLRAISSFHESETELLNANPVIGHFNEEHEAAFAAVSRFFELLDQHRAFFAALSEGGDLGEALEQIVKLQWVLSDAPDEIVDIAGSYSQLNVERSAELSTLAHAIEDLKRPIIGYLFRSKPLLEIKRQVEAILGQEIGKPQHALPEIKRAAGLREQLERLLVGRGAAKSHSPLLHRVLASPFRPGLEESSVIADYLAIERDRLNQLSLPTSPADLLAADSDAQQLMRAFYSLRTEERQISAAFERLPDFDYLKDKTDFEDLNARKLAHQIDKRVVSFVDQKRADAKTLQEVIRNKEKFPADKFEVLKDAFPCMIAGLREYAEFIPFESGLFDLVIIDEASQVSIAQALPALLRAKKMIVLGDRRQFGNVKTATASKALNNAYFSEVLEAFEKSVGKIDAALMARCRKLNITNSVMDFFELVTNYSIQLRKHFRGYPELIGFSSRYFYEGSLQIMKIRGKPIDEVLEFVVSDQPDAIEMIRNANRWEADKAIERLEAALEEESPPSIAIITPHREQQQLISKLVADHDRYDEFKKRLKIAVFTFDSCQGEERDLVIYSMVATRAQDRLNYIFPKDIREATEDEIDGKLKFQRLNVGFSRSKEKMLFLLSKPIEEYKGSARQALQHYSQMREAARTMPGRADVDPNSPMEAKLLDWLNATAFVTRHAGELEIVPQFELGAYLKSLDHTYQHPAYKVDFLLRLTTDSGVVQVIVEYDGFEYHFSGGGADAINWRHYLNEADIERECVLESYGYKMLRVNRFNIGRDPVSSLDERLTRIFEEFSSTDAQHQTLTTMHAATDRNLKGLAEGTHKKCPRCEKILEKQLFFDPTLSSKYGRICMNCKSAGNSRATQLYRRSA